MTNAARSREASELEELEDDEESMALSTWAAAKRRRGCWSAGGSGMVVDERWR
jgi:hypothetical protein